MTEPTRPLGDPGKSVGLPLACQTALSLHSTAALNAVGEMLVNGLAKGWVIIVVVNLGVPSFGKPRLAVAKG